MCGKQRLFFSRRLALLILSFIGFLFPFLDSRFPKYPNLAFFLILSFAISALSSFILIRQRTSKGAAGSSDSASSKFNVPFRDEFEKGVVTIGAGFVGFFTGILQGRLSPFSLCSLVWGAAALLVVFWLKKKTFDSLGANDISKDKV